MKNEKLYDGITGIREDIVERADVHEFKKKKRMTWQKWTALAACFCIVIGGVYGAARLGILGGAGSSAPGIGGGAGGGGNTGITYMSYTGPVFPLTAEGDASGIAAERNIDFDFSPYEAVNESYETATGETRSYTRYETEAIVTDGYTLTNTTEEDITVSGIYPFAGSFDNAVMEMPAITVDGTRIDTELFAGPFSGGYRDVTGTTAGGRWNIDNLNSWEQYRELLSDGSYMVRSFDEWPNLNLPVIVYEISDRAVQTGVEAGVADLKLSFVMDSEETTILTYGFNAGWNNQDTGEYARGTSVPESFNPDYGESAYLIVLGEDVENCTLQGWSDGWSKENDAVTGTLTRYETTLGEILYDLMCLYINDVDAMYDSDVGPFLWGNITEDMYFGAISELMYDYGKLSDDTAERYDDGMLEDMFSEARVMQRVMYLRFSVTIPAGGSVDVIAQMTKDASIDFIGANKDRNGYDMVTQLGSNLTFTSQIASISNTDNIEIIDQSFGFDLANGITEVELDMSVAHYWLEARKLPQEETP